MAQTQNASLSWRSCLIDLYGTLLFIVASESVLVVQIRVWEAEMLRLLVVKTVGSLREDERLALTVLSDLACKYLLACWVCEFEQVIRTE